MSLRARAKWQLLRCCPSLVPDLLQASAQRLSAGLWQKSLCAEYSVATQLAEVKRPASTLCNTGGCPSAVLADVPRFRSMPQLTHWSLWALTFLPSWQPQSLSYLCSNQSRPLQCWDFFFLGFCWGSLGMSLPQGQYRSVTLVLLRLVVSDVHAKPDALTLQAVSQH